MIRVLLVEDDVRLAAAVCALLASQAEFSVAGNYASAETALADADWAAADVFICDLELPGMGGVELIRKVRERAPDLMTLVYTVHEDQETVFAALRAGAIGYLLKGCSSTDLVAAVRKIHAGESPMSPAIARRLLDRFRVLEDAPQAGPLSVREARILRLLSRDMIYKEVAQTLGISQHTVHGHIKNIYGKLHVCDRTDALRKAEQMGYLRG